jgi:hypothetical protein
VFFARQNFITDETTPPVRFSAAPSIIISVTLFLIDVSVRGFCLSQLFGDQGGERERERKRESERERDRERKGEREEEREIGGGRERERD